MMGKNQSVGKGHTKWLGGPDCGPRATYRTPGLTAQLAQTKNSCSVDTYMLGGINFW